MFSFADAPVKVVALLIMFAFCTVWSVVEVSRSRGAVQRVGSVLHLLMSLVMLLMVVPLTWMPLRDLVTLPGLIAVFGASTLWFVYRAAVAAPDQRLHAWGHAAMFGAMTWHVTGMFVRHSAMMASGSMAGHGDMDMPSSSAMAVAIIGVPFMVYLLVSGLMELWQAVRPASVDRTAHREVMVHAGASTAAVSDEAHAGCLPEHEAGSRSKRLAALAAAAMNLGMFWMSTGLMAPVAPWLGVLTF